MHFRSAHRDRSLVILLLLASVLCAWCPSLQTLEIVRESPPWPLAISLLRFSSDHRSVNRVNSSGSNSGSRTFSRGLLATEPNQAVHGVPHFVMPPTSRSRDGGPPERSPPRIAVSIYLFDVMPLLFPGAGQKSRSTRLGGQTQAARTDGHNHCHEQTSPT